MVNDPKRKKSSTSPNPEVSESDRVEMTYWDPEVYKPISHPEALADYFDSDGCFKVPDGTAADGWKDAQRFAAVALDWRSELIRALSEDMGSPRWWGATEINAAQEAHELAETTVSVGVLGVPPTWREWDVVERLGGFPFNFSDCVKAAAKHAADATEPGQPYREKFRAKFAFLLASGCKIVVSRARDSKRSHDPKKEFRNVPGTVTPGTPVLLIKKVDALRNTARFLALAGQEKRRKQEDGRENIMTRIEAIAEFLYRAVHHPESLVDTSLPASMRPGAQGELKYQFETLALAIHELGEVSSEERSGAAFLVGATIYGWGDRSHEPTFQAALMRAQAKARPEDEDTRKKEIAHPVLRWKTALHNGLYALGHDAEQLSTSACKALEEKASDAKGTRPPKRS